MADKIQLPESSMAMITKNRERRAQKLFDKSVDALDTPSTRKVPGYGGTTRNVPLSTQQKSSNDRAACTLSKMLEQEAISVLSGEDSDVNPEEQIKADWEDKGE
jgi:hypothetical protein